MTWTEADEPVPLYINVYKGSVTPTGYLPMTVTGTTANGYQILTTGNTTQAANYTPNNRDIVITSSQLGNYIIPADYADGNTGYIKSMSTITTHGGYITKGDNNPTSDQGSLTLATARTLEPVQKDWVVGKALFTVPYVGLLPLHIGEVIVIVIILMVLHELYLRRKEDAETEAVKPKKGSKKKR
jgi:signal peptidase